MKRLTVTIAAAVLLACGGSEPAPKERCVYLDGAPIGDATLMTWDFVHYVLTSLRDRVHVADGPCPPQG